MKSIEITLPDSGNKITVRRFNSMIQREMLRELRCSTPEPEPPRQLVKYGDREEWEENRANPDYLAAMDKYNRALSDTLAQKTLELIVSRCVVCEVDKAAVDELREQTEAVGEILNASDKYLYVTCILCETPADLRALQNAAIELSKPTEAAIREAADQFRGNA